MHCVPCVGASSCVASHTGSRRGRTAVSASWSDLPRTNDCWWWLKNKGRSIWTWLWVQMCLSWRWNHILRSSIKAGSIPFFCADILYLERDFCVAFIFLACRLLHPPICYDLSACNAMQCNISSSISHFSFFFFFQISYLQIRNIFSVFMCNF